MAQAIVTIAGRTFRLGCDDGQEKRLEELASVVDGKIGAMRKNFGEIGDQRLIVMAALEIADEAADARARVSGLEEQIANLRKEIAGAQRREAAIEARLTQAIGGAAARLERLAGDLTPSDPDSEPLA